MIKQASYKEEQQEKEMAAIEKSEGMNFLTFLLTILTLFLLMIPFVCRILEFPGRIKREELITSPSRT